MHPLATLNDTVLGLLFYLVYKIMEKKKTLKNKRPLSPNVCVARPAVTDNPCFHQVAHLKIDLSGNKPLQGLPSVHYWKQGYTVVPRLKALSL